MRREAGGWGGGLGPLGPDRPPSCIIGVPGIMAQEVEMKRSAATPVLNSLAGESAKEVKKGKFNIPKAIVAMKVLRAPGEKTEAMQAMQAMMAIQATKAMQTMKAMQAMKPRRRRP